jgi:triosephosphate isomerase (TIM)
MRKKIVAGNWKMNLLPEDGSALINEIIAANAIVANQNKIVFCVPFTHIAQSNIAIKDCNNPNYLLGAQNCSQHASGAYTGEISLGMLQACGVGAVIIGHSERREYFAESNAMLKEKLDAVLAKNMMPLFCCGEPLEVRNANTQNDYVAKQLQESVFHLTPEQIAHVVIAYEPIWAIGTGVTASTQQAQDMHAFIRSLFSAQYGATIADQISILYGGSCNAGNAVELFSQADVDGGLIGGASLKAESFVAIINAMNASL